MKIYIKSFFSLTLLSFIFSPFFPAQGQEPVKAVPQSQGIAHDGSKDAVPLQAPPPAPPADARKILPLENVLHYTYLNNPTLTASREQLRATQELLPQAQAGYKPSVIAEGGVTRNRTAGYSFAQSGSVTSKDADITLNQPLYRGGRTMAESAAARYTIEAQSDILNAREQDILVSATTAYMNVVRDQALLNLSENNREVIETSLQVTSDRFKAGELTRTDVSQAQARLARARSEIIRTRGNLNSSKAVFSQVTGLPPQDLAEPDLNLPIPATLDDATAQTDQTSPLISAAVSTHNAAEKDIDGEFGNLLPEVGFVASYGKIFDAAPGISDDETNQAIGLSASVPLYEAGGVRSRVRQAKHTANQRYLEITETKLQARQDTITAWENLQAANAEIASRASEVEAAQIAREGVRQETEIGTRTVLDALDADQELLDAQVGLVTAKTDRIIAQFQLLSTMGLLTPSTLGFGNDQIRHDQNLAEIQHKIFSMDVDRVGGAR